MLRVWGLGFRAIMENQMKKKTENFDGNWVYEGVYKE